MSEQPPERQPVVLAPLYPHRRRSRVVQVGAVAVGGDNPVRIQSMLTCSTWDVTAVLTEIRALAAAGCEIVRLTVPTKKDLDALPAIREGMTRERLNLPLVADIHFNPKLALGVVPWVEKVRINPGNFVDAKRFEVREYSAAQYAQELARVEQTLVPLIRELKRHGRSLRIGVNHGSLSDRILNRHGDTPEGMVECALEYLRILAAHEYHEIVVSMKSSNPLVVIQAYRLLVLRMDAEGMDYPLHLGVTEAGNGPEGRVKSAIGIGALLCDGLGDTIRVSLTEPAPNEIPAASELVAAVNALLQGPHWPNQAVSLPLHFVRRNTLAVSLETSAVSGSPLRVGGGEPVRFVALAPTPESAPPGSLHDARIHAPALGPRDNGRSPLLLDASELDAALVNRLLAASPRETPPRLLLVRGSNVLYPLRWLAQRLDQAGLPWPLGIALPEVLQGHDPLGLAAEIGSLAADGLLDVLAAPNPAEDSPTAEFCRVLLQAARLRTYVAEYISCPSCGRTLFDLEETTARIKARTRHLTGVKIGIMGCIVNGPGEMADADFGYVGGAPGRVNLYKGQHCVARSIPTGEAVERLVELIKAHGCWVEPPVL